MEWVEEDDLVRDLQEADVALDGVDRDAQVAGYLGVREEPRRVRREEVLGRCELVEIETLGTDEA